MVQLQSGKKIIAQALLFFICLHTSSCKKDCYECSNQCWRCDNFAGKDFCSTDFYSVLQYEGALSSALQSDSTCHRVNPSQTAKICNDEVAVKILEDRTYECTEK